jgi:hypothetical protein
VWVRVEHRQEISGQAEVGDPALFYEKCGYVKYGTVKIGRKQNIDLMIKRAKK